MHKEFEKEREKERKDYFEEFDKGQNLTKSTSRAQKSATMIDYIEDLRVERYNAVLINSLSNRVLNSSFVKCKQRYSLVK